MARDPAAAAKFSRNPEARRPPGALRVELTLPGKGTPILAVMRKDGSPPHPTFKPGAGSDSVFRYGPKEFFPPRSFVARIPSVVERACVPTLEMKMFRNF